ncbi:helix-turn-helix domain-containing protein [Peptacetobacter sp.]|uniref:helix-turn-helix domain-containing protein n=1 Tax=Peptacetobacter sp. TaxID=2991975 RepID=UPI003AB6642B
MKLGDAIRITRQKAFYTQKKFSEELHVTVSTINRWELNKAKPNVKAMKSIKTFCEENKLDYKIIDSAWLGYSKEVLND